MNPETGPITFSLQRRRTDAGVEYRFSDRPDEVFPTAEELAAHRGLPLEQLHQTVTIITPNPKHES